jgi:hypothetical protein
MIKVGQFRIAKSLVKHNFQNPDAATTKVVSTDRGIGRAQQMAYVLSERLTPEEKQTGFAVFLQEGKKPTASREHRKPRDGRPNRRR